MRTYALLATLILGFALPSWPGQAQTAAPAYTATCKDGTSFSGMKRTGACRGHGGVQSWGTPQTGAAPAAPPSTAAGNTAAPAGGGAGQVWVNTASKVYHCPGDRWYGKTKRGSYMSEAQARAAGDRPDHGKACGS